MRLNPTVSMVCTITAFSFGVCSARASDYDLVCQNPGREYNLTYSVGDREVVIDPDSKAIRQAVLAFVDLEAARLVVLDLGQPGMASVLHLRPYLKNDIFADGELVQTDACHDTGH